MKSDFRSAARVLRVLIGITLTAAVGWSSAQTPAQMEYERQQREYRLQQERQREQQQLMNENARRQQEQSSRINAPAGQSPSYAPPATQCSSGAGRGAGGAEPTGAQAASAARAMWEKRPALPPGLDLLNVARRQTGG